MGVRISWLIFDRKLLFALLASSAASRASRSSFSFSSSSVTSSRLINTPLAVLPVIIGEQFTRNLCHVPFWCCSHSGSPRSVSLLFSARVQGNGFCSASAVLSGWEEPLCHLNPSAFLPISISADSPLISWKAVLAKTTLDFLSTTSKPSASVSSAERTRPGTACDGLRALSIFPRYR